MRATDIPEFDRLSGPEKILLTDAEYLFGEEVRRVRLRHAEA